MGWDDDRAVSEVLGAMLLFGILILALGGYQAFVVPQQNSEIEFDHNERAAGDMQDFRNAMIHAVGDNEPRSASIELRPQYPSRAFSLNPGPPGGSIQTNTEGPIEISNVGHPADNADLTSGDVCGATGEDSVETRSVTFTPNYNAYQNGQPVTVDNSMVYRRADDQFLVDTSQVLIKGSEIHLTPVKGNLAKSGERSVSITTIPSNSGGFVVNETAADNFNITIPTTLDAETWHNELNDTSAYVVDVHDTGADSVKIELRGTDSSNGPTPGSYTIRCTGIGLDQYPGLNPPPLPFEDELGDIQSGLNPYGAFVLENSTITDDGHANITFRHRGDEVSTASETDLTIDRMRFVYYMPVGQGAGEGEGQPFVPPDTAQYQSTNFEIGGPDKDVDGKTWEPGTTKNITVTFENGDYAVNDGDFFIIRIQLEGSGIDDIIGEYFIAPRPE